jgi:hypothetical protein
MRLAADGLFRPRLPSHIIVIVMMRCFCCIYYLLMEDLIYFSLFIEKMNQRLSNTQITKFLTKTYKLYNYNCSLLFIIYLFLFIKFELRNYLRL